jgi:phage-related protein
MSYFVFKGINSESRGVIVAEYPEIVRAQQRIETVQVPGRDGELTLVSGLPVYNTILKNCGCIIAPNADINAISAWLTGRGDVTFGNEPLHTYEARIKDEIAFEKIMREREYREFVIPFYCHPLKKLTTTEQNIELTASGNVTNPGTAFSRPKIKVEGSGDITLTVSGQIIDIAGLAEPIVIDSDVGLTTDATGTVNMCYLTSGDYPRLAPGTNAISWTGTVTKVTITPRWRWL